MSKVSKVKKCLELVKFCLRKLSIKKTVEKQVTRSLLREWGHWSWSQWSFLCMNSLVTKCISVALISMTHSLCIKERWRKARKKYIQVDKWGHGLLENVVTMNIISVTTWSLLRPLGNLIIGWSMTEIKCSIILS